ncbi:hypothetical protein PCS_01805 [Desulfocurvibacter africanus PCS]|uniref:DUF6538 domain-containing protein n=1 Tax=Desulfocurvibacter africanus PCS TaxID=1262666 RepID=M5PTC4_DESAF|nr:hypothetical protein PCS_01805 [Desulfocurvibacter africanus PCS]
MKAIETRAPHLFQRGSVYYFRLAIRRPLRLLAGYTEIRSSLRTGH